MRRLLAAQLSLIEWVVCALAVALPYLGLGVVWAILHGELFVGLAGPRLATSLLAAIASWPVQLVFPPLCGPG
ncbi:hypothetical protein H7J07_02315 [Mycobacterium koreense]|uniref:Uncharacterized protein n=1 Tax=Mycolicibacillus koreensis TaxID=1069220 RepID=A0A7I7SJ47_9MYCO|nr:hypothetical protein [Mycolicibacillus koreensis]MCV7247094.1 hypothetical protein [Mycolicibacillus koreensis]OSC31883.1 hypothetical protein B8W67_15465 [Mycolicibacillus koreensis]BBY55956.1 hypothetical protein MKOR_32070 [Mycolicibacillus koreensis]